VEPVTRRSFVGKVGGVVAASLFISAKGLAGEEKSPKEQGRKSNKPGMIEVSPVEDLMREHGVLSRCLLIYDETIARIGQETQYAPEPLAEAAGLIRRFVEEYHEKLEENYIFPRFVKAGKLADLVTILQAQHQAGRRLTERILRAAASKGKGNREERKKLAQDLRLFARMYRPHKAREDTVLFPALHLIVSREEYDSLGEAFEEKEEEFFGKDGFEKIVGEVAGVEEKLGLYDLAQFTPKT
jgi:hemerythrin-like domain-containing protein